MYYMLSGEVPFLKKKDADTLEMIKAKPRVRFSGAHWAKISSAAKDVIRAMLEPEPQPRPSAAEVRGSAARRRGLRLWVGVVVGLVCAHVYVACACMRLSRMCALVRACSACVRQGSHPRAPTAARVVAAALHAH